MSKPSTNGTSGRTSNGQFAKGNPGGTGKPYARTKATAREFRKMSIWIDLLIEKLNK